MKSRWVVGGAALASLWDRKEAKGSVQANLLLLLLCQRRPATAD